MQRENLNEKNNDFKSSTTSVKFRVVVEENKKAQI